MENIKESPRRTRRRYPPEMRERAIRLVEELGGGDGDSYGVQTRVANQLGVGYEAVRKWVREARQGRPSPTPEQLQLLALEREIAELRRANDILKAACAVFAGDATPRLPR
jgi:transposase